MNQQTDWHSPLPSQGPSTGRTPTLFLLCVLALSGFAWAQHGSVKAKVNATVSADNNAQIGSGSFRPVGNEYTLNYGLSPSLSLDYQGERYRVEALYSFGLNRFNLGPDLDYESHQVGGSVEAELGSRWNMNFSSVFFKSPDFTQSTVLEGIRVTPEGLFFDYENVILRRDSYAATSALGFDYEMTPVSDLTIGVSQQLRRFDQSKEFFGLSDQSSYQGHLGYRRRLDERTSLDVRYGFSHRDFRDFENTRDHSVIVGISHQFTPELSVGLAAGPSYVQSGSGLSSGAGMMTDLSISYSRNEDTLSLSFRTRKGDSTGLGSVSDTRHLSASFHKLLRRGIVLTTVVTAYDAKPLFDNPIETRGAYANVVFSFSLFSGWAFQMGGSYADQRGTSQFELDRTRVFVGLRYDFGELFRF